MKFIFTLLSSLLVFTLDVSAQKEITGIWKGYFVQNSLGGYYQDRYKFEVQVEQLTNNAINGITYSYKTTVFYGKASLSGLYTKNTKVLTITETKLLEVKVEGQSEACLMTCYLEYSKTGELETLTGTYTSRNMRDKADCGSGKVYLEKTLASDFYKEDFLVKREYELSKKKPAVTNKILPGKSPLQNKPTAKITPKKPMVVDKPTAQNTLPKKPVIKPGAEDNLVTVPDKKITPAPPTAVMPQEEKTVNVPKPTVKHLPRPEIMRKRNNELVKTFYTSAKEIKVDLYDNGEIDGDTITVYHNNKLIAYKKRLTDKPITFTIKTDEIDPEHEFVMVAENLGSIPPNTALMVITAGGKRYELFVTSTEQKNAVVIVEYKPEQANTHK